MTTYTEYLAGYEEGRHGLYLLTFSDMMQNGEEYAAGYIAGHDAKERALTAVRHPAGQWGGEPMGARARARMVKASALHGGPLFQGATRDERQRYEIFRARVRALTLPEPRARPSREIPTDPGALDSLQFAADCRDGMSVDGYWPDDWLDD